MKVTIKFTGAFRGADVAKLTALAESLEAANIGDRTKPFYAPATKAKATEATKATEAPKPDPQAGRISGDGYLME